jgi:N-acetylneuraminate lyase
MAQFLSEAAKVIPNMAGIKFTDTNFMQMQQCLALDNGKYDIIQGKDENLLCGLAIGVEGAIGTTYNFLPGLYLELIKAFNRGDIKAARELQLISVRVFESIIKYGGGIITGKAMLKMAGIDCGPCRSPLRSLTAGEVTAMKKELMETGFFDWLAKI